MKYLKLILLLLLLPSVCFGFGVGTVGSLGSGVGGTESAVYTDYFNRANENPLGTPWVTVTGQPSFKIVSNYVEANGPHAAVYYDATFSDNQYSSVLTGETYLKDSGVTVRNSTTAYTCYRFNRTGASSVRIDRLINGSYTTIGTCSGTPSFTGGAVLRLEVSGSSLTGKVNDVTYCTASDPNISSGKPGMYLRDINKNIDDWAGGDL